MAEGSQLFHSVKDLINAMVTPATWLTAAPFIIMSGTLTLADTIINYLTFSQREEVGLVDGFYIHAVRELRPYPLVSWKLEKYGFLHNKRVAIFDTRAGLSRIATALKGNVNLDDVRISSVDEKEMILSYQGKDYVIRYGELEERKDRISLPSGDGMEYVVISEKLDLLFSEVLSKPVSVLYSPTHKLSGAYNYPIYVGRGNNLLPLPPVHIISKSTVTLLEAKSGRKMEVERFRPNLVVTGSRPYDEDLWHTIQVGDVILEATFMAPRCGKITILKGQIDPKVYDSVNKHARKNAWNQPCVGSLFKVLRPGVVKDGDKVVVLKRLDKPLSEQNISLNKEKYVIGL